MVWVLEHMSIISNEKKTTESRDNLRVHREMLGCEIGLRVAYRDLLSLKIASRSLQYQKAYRVRRYHV